ncbi:AMP-binding protein [Microbacterium sp. zg.Y625]|uniref:AMP-binding protein n=1 Tax=Microbacterium jiangjiandongii TaxID=3049071 RepID=UPI00214A9763|nr:MULTISPECIES: AMP-binding protein [unclassified Microbacterium]MCR2793479.1 AMP-binding protein [Microbacterium sp. zg.Y625]MCR2815343.1 AMP-binding protein [Microbacterium sp. zg.Y843]WIM25154.1 AMP-binding protein [Microbacterium sp. zg-Y625]
MARWHGAGYWTGERIGWTLERRADSWPHRTAAITAGGHWTYAELQRLAAAVARTLVARGVRAGDVVAWMLPTTPEAIAVASAIWRIGAVSAPLVPIWGPLEVTVVLDQLRPAAIITNAQIRGRDLPGELDSALDTIGHSPATRLLVRGGAAGWGSADAEGPGSLPERVEPGAPGDPSLILFTSGSESSPKGVVHTGAGLTHEVRACIGEWGVTFRDRMFMASPMTHITGLLQGFLIPARVGGAAILMDRWDAAEAVTLIERHRATYMAGATPFLRELLQAYAASGRDSSALVQYCCGGAAVPPHLIRDADALGVTAYRAWGMTELPTATLSSELDSLDARADTDGRLAPGVELRVLDDEGAELPTGEVGALHLRAPEMMVGYLREDLTRAVIGDGGWLDTGDVGWIGQDGYVRVSGRTKDIINRGGEKFSSREIEDLVSRHPDVEAVAIVAVPGGRLGERIGALVVSPRPDLTLAELGAFVTALGAAKQKQPEHLVIVAEIPSTSTGKVDKRAALALFPDDD